MSSESENLHPDPAALAAIAGAEHCGRADPEDVPAATSYVSFTSK